MMGWLIAGVIASAIVSGVGIYVSHKDKENEIAYTKQQDALNLSNQNKNDIASYLSQIESSYSNIDQYLKEIDSIQSIVTSDQEYVGIYEQILNGDRTGSEEARNLAVLENNISIADSNIEAYLKQQQLAETNAQNYLKQASIEKKNAVEAGISSYSDMLKQQSMSNVMASSSGASKSAYSSAALRQENQIMNYIGVDMKFNRDVEGGSFVDNYILLENQILAQINSNNESIRLLGESKQQAEMEKTRAQGDLDTQFEKLESEYNRVTGDNGSIASNQRAIDTYQQSIEMAKANLNLWKTNAIDSLKSYRNNASAAGISESEVNSYINSLKDGYKDKELPDDVKKALDEIFA